MTDDVITYDVHVCASNNLRTAELIFMRFDVEAIPLEAGQNLYLLIS
jgi:hypothetical protein